MKIITSPAKLMTVNADDRYSRSTTPVFISEAEHLMATLKEKTPRYLQDLMEISPKIADENWERNQNWTAKPKNADSAQALFAFTGEVYRGIGASTLSESALNYLKKNYRILSGLYGLLKPTDRIMLYRLEMGRNFKTENADNIYNFWSDKITEELNNELKSKELVLNLASKEYFKVIDRKKLKAKIIDFDFYELKSGTPKTIVVYTKHARGLLVRFCAETNAKTLNDVKAFNYEGYRVDEERSTDTHLIFTR